MGVGWGGEGGGACCRMECLAVRIMPVMHDNTWNSDGTQSSRVSV